MNSIDALWEELIFEVGSIGPQIKNKKNLIGCGNRHGDILFIGDDQNLYTDEDMKYDAGSSGEFLIKLCQVSGLTSDDYYITTLSKTNREFKDYLENDQKKLVEYLNMQIALINPKIIVALGSDVATILLEREFNFAKEKNVIQDWLGDIKIITTYDATFAKNTRDTGGKKEKVPVEFWNALKMVKAFLEGRK